MYRIIIEAKNGLKYPANVTKEELDIVLMRLAISEDSEFIVLDASVWGWTYMIRRAEIVAYSYKELKEESQ
ncbi:hypothetical protein [Bacillus pumilus]|jgi:hypothetical protein|uniref:hypothetical protein n=1 Tax=Bacillus pumilus TaxID=1408 RepID=UPI00209C9541|nr:hypothetical protein [Bacillus pumilus]MCP1528588.1 hypothetical protein [Bacillus pumilus]MDF9783968.1 hypothetical protein [Bacillus pumilus]